MKPKLFLHLTFLFTFIVCLAQTSHAITEFGQNPFYSKGVTSSDTLKSMLIENETDVRSGLKKAGHSDIADALFIQLPNVKVTQVEYQKGQKFPWMFYRKNGKGPVRIDKDVVWEGDASFTAYEFPIDYNGKRYTFMMPPVCGNLTLLDVAMVPPPQSAVATPTPPPPVESPAPTEQPVTVATSDEKTESAFGFPIIADIGYLYQFDPANYMLFRIGIEHAYSDTFSVIGMVGVSAKLDGTEGTSAFLIDLFANYNWTNWYGGVGLGGWITDGDSDVDHEDTDLDIILNFGRQVYEKQDSYTVDLFAEVRSAVDELDDFDLYGRIGAGVRIRF